jgi:hypothetical protein
LVLKKSKTLLLGHDRFFSLFFQRVEILIPPYGISKDEKKKLQYLEIEQKRESFYYQQNNKIMHFAALLGMNSAQKLCFHIYKYNNMQERICDFFFR